MTEDKELALVRDFPELFTDWRGSPRQTCMAWGCAVGDGWEPLLRRLCEAARLEPGVRFAQVKEKFGALRVYWRQGDGFGGGSEALWELSNAVEAESLKVCEACGTREGVETRGGWIKTLCGACRVAWDNRKTPGLAEARVKGIGGIDL
jgi:hypothetical protein